MPEANYRRGSALMRTAFNLGGEDNEYIRIAVLARAHPSETDYWDGNWLITEVQLAVGPFSGAYRADLRAEDFSMFREQLQRLYEDVAGEPAVFESMEPWLRLTVTRSDRLGHIKVRGLARPAIPFPGHNTLEFGLDIDQSFLPATLADLLQITAEFPVLGSPSDSGKKRPRTG